MKNIRNYKRKENNYSTKEIKVKMVTDFKKESYMNENEILKIAD